jgi:hypothetical protein
MGTRFFIYLFFFFVEGRLTQEICGLAQQKGQKILF